MTFFFPLCAAAQAFQFDGPPLPIDSLKKVLPSLHNSRRVDCLNELSGSYFTINIDTARSYATQAYNEAFKINYAHGIAESLSYKAEIEDHFENRPAVEKFSHEAIEWYRKTSNKKRVADAYFYLGAVLYAESFFTEAIKNFDTAYEWYKKFDYARGMCLALYITSAVYDESGDYERSLELKKKCLDLSIKNNDDEFRRFVLTGIGGVFINIEDHKSALEYYRLAFMNLRAGEIIKGSHMIHVNQLLALAELFTCQKQYDSAKYYYSFIDTSEQRAHRFFLLSIGEYYFAQEQYDKALPSFIRGLSYHQQYNDRNQVMRSLTDIAKTFLATGNIDSALKYGMKTLILADKTGAKQVVRDACKILSSVYDNLKRPDSAYFYYKRYTTMNDSVLNNQVKGKIAAYTFEQRIELLNKEKQIREAQLQKQSLLKIFLLLV